MGLVGPPVTGVELKLINWNEGGYTVKDKPHPRGEIVVGGDAVTKGYFKMPQETSENYFEENNRRWFRSGDIGEIQDDGVLKIIGEKCI